MPLFLPPLYEHPAVVPSLFLVALRFCELGVKNYHYDVQSMVGFRIKQSKIRFQRQKASSEGVTLTGQVGSCS